MKFWRNKALAGQTVTLMSRRLKVDNRGFVRDELLPEEVAKCHKMGKKHWSFVDENAEEVVQESLNELGAALKAEVAEWEAAKDVVDARWKRVAAIQAKIDEVKAKALPAPVLAPIVTETTPFKKVLEVAEKGGIVTDGATRDSLVEAIEAQADSSEPKGPKTKKGGEK